MAYLKRLKDHAGCNAWPSTAQNDPNYADVRDEDAPHGYFYDADAKKRQKVEMNRVVRARDLAPSGSMLPSFGMSGGQTNSTSLLATLPSSFDPVGSGKGSIDGNSLVSADVVMGAVGKILGGANYSNSKSEAPEDFRNVKHAIARFKEEAFPFLQPICLMKNIPAFIHTYRGTDRNGAHSLKTSLSWPVVNFAMIRAMLEPHGKIATFLYEWAQETHPTAAWPTPKLLEAIVDESERLSVLHELRRLFVVNAIMDAKFFGIMRTQAGVPSREFAGQTDVRTAGICTDGRQKIVNLWAYTSMSTMPGAQLWIALTEETVHVSSSSTPIVVEMLKPHVVPPWGPVVLPKNWKTAWLVANVASDQTEVQPTIEATTGDHYEFDIHKHPVLASLLTCSALPTSAAVDNYMRSVMVGNANAGSGFLGKELEQSNVDVIERGLLELGHIEVHVKIGRPRYNKQWSGGDQKYAGMAHHDQLRDAAGLMAFAKQYQATRSSMRVPAAPVAAPASSGSVSDDLSADRAAYEAFYKAKTTELHVMGAQYLQDDEKGQFAASVANSSINVPAQVKYIERFMTVCVLIGEREMLVSTKQQRLEVVKTSPLSWTLPQYINFFYDHVLNASRDVNDAEKRLIKQAYESLRSTPGEPKADGSQQQSRPVGGAASSAPAQQQRRVQLESKHTDDEWMDVGDEDAMEDDDGPTLAKPTAKPTPSKPAAAAAAAAAPKASKPPAASRRAKE